jgi:hypothetical protein
MRRETEPLLLTVQEKDRGSEQLASLKTRAAMSGNLAIILLASGCGERVVREEKNRLSA